MHEMRLVFVSFLFAGVFGVCLFDVQLRVRNIFVYLESAVGCGFDRFRADFDICAIEFCVFCCFFFFTFVRVLSLTLN